MEYSFKQVCINSPFPVTQQGHIQQTYLVNTYKDDLHARIFAFRDTSCWLIWVSADLIEVPASIRLELQKQIRDFYNNPDIHLVGCATHSHYCCSIADKEYATRFTDIVAQAIKEMVYEEKGDIYLEKRSRHCECVGRSRISGYETGNEQLTLLSFKNDKEYFLNIVHCNIHPTTLEATTPFFSAEYPGYVLRRLKNDCPNQDFTFFQGSAGDMSSRFIRKGKSYQDMEGLAEKLYLEICELRKTETKKEKISLSFEESVMSVEHDFTPVDVSAIRKDISDREKETIGYGMIIREQMRQSGNYLREINAATVDFDAVRFKTFGVELFSDYMKCCDDRTLLVCYCNGDGAYILPLNFPFVTYESFYDTSSAKTKQEIMDYIAQK